MTDYSVIKKGIGKWSDDPFIREQRCRQVSNGRYQFRLPRNGFCATDDSERKPTVVSNRCCRRTRQGRAIMNCIDRRKSMRIEKSMSGTCVDFSYHLTVSPGREWLSGVKGNAQKLLRDDGVSFAGSPPKDGEKASTRQETALRRIE